MVIALYPNELVSRTTFLDLSTVRDMDELISSGFTVGSTDVLTSYQLFDPNWIFACLSKAKRSAMSAR
jgi:hypothetical protein